jgi:hypothetical protein
MKEENQEELWCHYSGMPSPNAYIKSQYPVYDYSLEVYKFTDFPEFTPSYPPIEMVKMGVFGGNYFGNQEVNKNWEDYVPTEFVEECTEAILGKITNETYNIHFNKYGVNCGIDYEGWIKSGWIIEQDPYGWFNWYINFYYGRRSSDDNRQIKRWKSFVSRHSGMLRSLCAKSNKDLQDESFSLKTRQGLLHWAYKIK